MVMAKWDNRFIALAQHIAEWSKDPSTKVGAVLVDADRRVVSMGYNGAPRGTAEPSEGDREQKLMRTIHAEENALHFAHRDVAGCTMYISRPPCAKCAAHMIQRGVKEVVYTYDGYDYQDYMSRWKESFMEAVTMLAEAGVQIKGVTNHPPTIIITHPLV
jgi:dCMP deaminase